jgi:hypothetical protein
MELDFYIFFGHGWGKQSIFELRRDGTLRMVCVMCVISNNREIPSLLKFH